MAGVKDIYSSYYLGVIYILFRCYLHHDHNTTFYFIALIQTSPKLLLTRTYQ